MGSNDIPAYKSKHINKNNPVKEQLGDLQQTPSNMMYNQI